MRKLKVLFCKLTMKLCGWKLIHTLPKIDKSIICIAPHTSNWDFFICKLFYSSLGVKRPKFLMKKEWFFFPLGLIFKHFGGIPVNRKLKTSLTDQVAELFAKSKELHIGITPEGTRKAVQEWKYGFYYIALKAKVPIQLAYLDYKKKEVGLTYSFFPTGNLEADMAKIKEFYRYVTPCHPKQFIV